MDNASKALIMAGAILIAVAIVGIGIYIFSSANSLTNDAVDQIDTIAVQMFNNTFTQYANDGDTINGTRAQQLYDIVRTYNDTDITKSGLAANASANFAGTKAYVVHYNRDKNTKYITGVSIQEKTGTTTPARPSGWSY